MTKEMMKTPFNTDDIYKAIEFYCGTSHDEKFNYLFDIRCILVAIEDSIKKYIESLKANNVLPITRDQLVRVLTDYMTVQQKSGRLSEATQAIINKLISDEKLFGKIAVIKDGSYIDFKININLVTGACVQMRDQKNNKRQNKHYITDSNLVEKLIEKLYREYDTVFIHFQGFDPNDDAIDIATKIIKSIDEDKACREAFEYETYP